ncbi:MAG: glycosyltransferase family 2 protein [Thermaceae bacterium]|nr:glycosyltransferase family 2 protein [Thermaceae bacterium]
MYTIDCVIVTFNPNINTLQSLVISLLGQVRNIYIIDNSSDCKYNIEVPENVRIIRLVRNYGIAYAQNYGILISLSYYSDFILISDQDTIYPKNYVKDMISLFSIFDKTAGVSPVFVDSKSNVTFPSYYMTKYRFKKFYPYNGIYEVSQTISSGLIINSKYLPDIGLMNEDFFIDWVDTEWCWRAIKKGYKVLLNSNVKIYHNFGDRYLNLFNKNITIRNHIRHYYITRNAFYLSLYCKHISIYHRIYLFIFSFKYIFGYPILSKNHLLNLRFVLLGFIHGLFKRMGSLSN